MALPFLLRNCRNLVCLTIDEVEMVFSESSPAPSMFTIENSIHYAKALCDLRFFRYANVGHPSLLKELTLFYCLDFSMSGLSLLLRSYQSLTYLNLRGTKFLTDQSIGELSQYLHNLTYIGLSSCSNLTNSTFFIITRNFPALEEIQMVNTRLGIEEDFGVTLYQNHKIKVLNLVKNKHLNDESLKQFGVICPNLEELKVSYCSHITCTGIGEILKSCNTLQTLKMSEFCCSNIIVSDSEISHVNLKILFAERSKIDDAGMTMIGKNCNELRHLDLEGCLKVTAKGVKEVVGNCKKLREISLKNCCNISDDTLDWMVSSRPTLRIIPPCPLGFQEEE